MKKQAGMTRSDGVVILACITIIIITMGAVGSSGRRRAKEMVCQSNLRQWGGIFQGYVERNNDRFFTGTQYSPGYWWPKELDDAHKNWKQTKIWFCPEATKPTYDEQGHMSQTLSVFNAWGIFTGDDLGTHGLSGSYGLNGYTIIPTNGSRYESGVSTDEGWHPTGEEGAANVPWFFDALRFDLWPLETDPPALNEFAAWNSNNMARCCINRHNGTINSLFLDGSARKVGLKELWTLKWHKSFNTRGPWTIAGGVQPTDWPEWIRPFKDY